MAQAFIRISLEIRRLCIEDWKYDAPEFCSALLHFSLVLGLQIYLSVFIILNMHIIVISRRC